MRPFSFSGLSLWLNPMCTTAGGKGVAVLEEEFDPKDVQEVELDSEKLEDDMLLLSANVTSVGGQAFCSSSSSSEEVEADAVDLMAIDAHIVDT